MAVATKFEIHPLAELIPAMSDEEFTELRDDIRENGLREPVTLYKGKLLDGRHRARACEELGLEPATREYEGDAPADYVISLNLRRRHLTVGQRAMAALALLDYETEEASKRMAEGGKKSSPGRPEKGGQNSATLSEPAHKRATAEAGKKLGVSRDSVEKARALTNNRPDLAEKVERGQISLNAAVEQDRGYPTNEVICELLRGKKREELHEMFRQVNDARTINHAEKFLHRIGQKEPKALEIVALLEREGFNVSTSAGGTSGAQIHSTAVLEWIWDGGDKALQKRRGKGPHRGALTLALAAYRHLAGDRHFTQQGALLKGLGAFFLRYPEVDSDRLLTKLQERYASVPKLLAATKQTKDDFRISRNYEAFGFIARNAYNGSRRQSKQTLPEWRA